MISRLVDTMGKANEHYHKEKKEHFGAEKLKRNKEHGFLIDFM